MKHANTVTTPPRPLSELNLMDDFLFQEMLAQEDIGEEFCRILLSTILGKPLRKVRVIPQKPMLGSDTDKHGIRMDAYIEDLSTDFPENVPADENLLPDVYDLEPNRHYEKKTLPKRARYYHGLIDTRLLTVGSDYGTLQNVVIILILPYDPFHQNRMRYTIRNQCVEDPNIPYDDGAQKIFLYTQGTEGTPSQELRDMLKYLETTTAENVTNKDIEAIHRLVTQVKQRREVGIHYMKSWELEALYRKEGREAGFAEGLEEGRELGMELGLKQGLEQGLEQGIEQSMHLSAKAIIQTCHDFHATKEETYSKLIENLSLTTEQATIYMDAFW